VNGLQRLSTMNGDDWMRAIALAMAMTLVIAAMMRRLRQLPRSAWPMLVLMALVWIVLITVAAFAFRNYHPGGL